MSMSVKTVFKKFETKMIFSDKGKGLANVNG